MEKYIHKRQKKQKGGDKVHKKVKKGIYLFSLTLIFAVILAGAATAEDQGTNDAPVVTTDTTTSDAPASTPQTTTTSTDQQTADAQNGDEGNPLPEDPADIAVEVAFYNDTLDIVDALNNGFPTPITSANDGDTVWKVVRCYNTGYSGALDPAYVHVLDYLDPTYYTINNYQMWTIHSDGTWHTFAGTYDTTNGDWNVFLVQFPLQDYWDNYLFINVTVHGFDTTITNQASVLSSMTSDTSGDPVFDPVLSNNIAGVPLQLEPAADIQVDKVWEDTTGTAITTANYLQTVVAHITVTNNGPSPANGVVLTDTLPADFTFDASQSMINYYGVWYALTDCPHWTYDAVTRLFTWNITYHIGGAMPSGDVYQVRLFGNNTAHGGTTVTNTADVDPATLPQEDPDWDNNQQTAEYTALMAADLAASKVWEDTSGVAIDSANYLQTVVAHISITNLGPDTADNAVLTDQLPAGFVLDTVNSYMVRSWEITHYYLFNTGYWTYDQVTGLFTLDVSGFNQMIFNGETVNAYLYFTNSAHGNAIIDNTAVASSTTFDQNLTNNVATDSYTANAAADIRVDKVFQDALGNPITNADYGSTVVSLITVTNNGPDAANGVFLTDILPAELQWITAEISLDNGVSWRNFGQNWVFISGQTVTWDTINNELGGIWPDPANPWPMAAGTSVLLRIWATNIGHGNTLVTNDATVNPDPALPNPLAQYDQNWTNNVGTAQFTANAYAHVVLDKYYADYDQFVNHNYNIVPITNPVNYLDNVIVILTAHNEGPDPVTYLQVQDTWPAALVGTSEAWDHPDATTWNFFPWAPSGTVSWWPTNVVTLNPGDTFLTAIGATVSDSDTTITNTITTIAQTPMDPVGYDTASADLEVNAASDIEVEKEWEDTSGTEITEADYNQSIVADIEVTNNGPDTAYGVVLTDTLPEGFVLDTSMSHVTYNQLGQSWNLNSCAHWTYDTTTRLFTWYISQHLDTYGVGMLPGDANNCELELYGTNTAHGNTLITNTALVNPDPALPNPLAQYDPDWDNNHDTASYTALAAADIDVDKVWEDTTGTAIATANYLTTVVAHITVTNNGPDAANGVVLTDTLPFGFDFDPANSWIFYGQEDSQRWSLEGCGHWTYDAVTRLFTWNINSHLWNALLPGDANACEVWLYGTNTAHAGWPVFNTAGVNPANLPQLDQNWTNNYATDFYIANPAADLAVTKDVDDATPDLGQLICFTIDAKNFGPDWSWVTVNDVLPAGLVYNAATYATQGTYDILTHTWTVGWIAPGAFETLYLYATVNPGPNPPEKLTNTATITGYWWGFVPEYDQNMSNNIDTEDVFMPMAMVTIDKSVNVAIQNVGQNIIYTLTAHNGGPKNATNVIINDVLPAGLTYVSQSGDGIYAAGVWTITQIDAFTDAVIHITATVGSSLAGTTVTNTATLYQLDQYDPFLGDTGSASFYVPSADVAVAKQFWNDTEFVNNNYNIVYITTANYLNKVIAAVKVTNNGPDTATNVVVKDTWPSELTSTGNWWVSWNNGVTWILNDPSYNPLNNEWAVGTVTTLNTFWLAIEGIVDDSDTTILNQADKTAQTEYDPVQANNHAEASIAVPPAAALELTKTVNNANPTLHDTVIFTMIVQNHGPDTATTVKVSDVLPAGLTYVSSSADFGSYDSTTGIWTIGNLPANTIAHLTITCTVEQTGTINNEAKVTSLTYDPELYPRSALVTVNVKAPASTPSQPTSVAAGTISMQTTGAPFVPLALGILLLFAGFATTRRKP